MSDIFSVLRCPGCKAHLHREGKSLICEAGHTFDIAKSGYVNLLPPGKEKNAHTGDERVMIRARADFLAHGAYYEISRKLSDTLAEHMPESNDVVICDMGCGEGYHTCNITQQIGDRYCGVLSIGFDASKYAAECASKLSRSLGLLPQYGIGGKPDGRLCAYFTPANIFALPVNDSVFDAAVSMFAPIAWDEVRRILKPGGVLAVVSSGKHHLIEMRELIYDEVILSESLPAAADGFECCGTDSLTYTSEINSTDDILNLFKMTPFYYKTTEAGREKLYSKSSLSVTVDVNYSFFRLI